MTQNVSSTCRRSDFAQAALVEIAIRLQAEHGSAVAEEFLNSANLRFEAINRVLSEPSKRRTAPFR